MANYILLVFEGQTTEPTVWNSLNKYYLNDLENTIIYGVYCCEIYSLFHRKSKDPDLDLFLMLKGMEENKILLEDVSKDDVSEIFLFFDYDGHATAADDAKLNDMLSFFCEETDNGKLYLSYPMVEAIKHLADNIKFSDVTVQCKEKISYGEKKISYKEYVGKEGSNKYRNIAKFDKDTWKYIISEHCCKLSDLMGNGFNFPDEHYDQISIFSQQLDKHINNKREVSVLSSFPIFILDYYGSKRTKILVSADG